MQPFVYNFPFFSIFLAMLCGILTPLMKNGAWAKRLNLAMLSLVAGMSAVLLFTLVHTGSSFTYQMGHFPAPWGNELFVGPLEALFALCFAVVMILAILGGERELFADILPEKQKYYFVMLNLLLSSLLALNYTNDVFTAYVFIEINTIASCAIVMARDSGSTVVATIRYLIVSLLGSGLFLIGIILLYRITGHLLMPNLRTAVKGLVATGRYTMPLTVVVGLVTLGVCIKSALYPFHTWLPNAHAAGTVVSSSILSGLVLKGYVVLLIKLFYRIFSIEVVRSLRVTNVMFVFGLAGMVMASVHAMHESNIKRMLAYSSIAQIGYLYMGLGLGTEAGVVAACFHILVHAVSKPLLFTCAAGLSEVSEHSKELYSLHGAGRRKPLAGIGFTVGALSMIGIPLLAGFVSKWLFASAAVSSPFKMLPALVVLSVSTVLNALYYLPAVIRIWTPEPEARHLKRTENRTAASFVVSVSTLVALVFALGIGYEPILKVIRLGLSLL